MKEQACHVCGVTIIPDKPVCLSCAEKRITSELEEKQKKEAPKPVRFGKAPDCKSKIMHKVALVLDECYQFKANYEDLGKAIINADHEIVDIMDDMEYANDGVVNAINCLEENGLSATQEMVDLKEANERFVSKPFHLFKKHTITIAGYGLFLVLFIGVLVYSA